MRNSLLISAGEVSGDKHGAEVISILRNADDSLKFFGIGGDILDQNGVELIEHSNKLAFMGLSEVVRNYPFIRSVMRKVLAKVDVYKPIAALLVDYPCFNLQLAKELKKRNIKVYYFISPKFWAWNYRRVKKLRSRVDHMLSIFPFEAELLKQNKIQSTYVGNPLIQQINCQKKLDKIALPWRSGKKIAILPGSRKQEIDFILPILIEASEKLSNSLECSFIIAVPNNYIAQIIREMDIPKSIKIVLGNTLAVLKQADAAWIASGTATLEAAILNTPHVLVYKTSALTNFFARIVIKLPYVGLVNILSAHHICPELLQNNANAENLVDEISLIINKHQYRQTMLDGFANVRHILGSKLCSNEVAKEVLKSYH